MLPIESHIARFQIVRPLPSLGKGSTLTAEEAAVREGMLQEKPVAIILAGTGEQGYQRRRHFTACPLARLGVSSIILESPYYGSRRPAKQVASKLRK
jgi:Alpha/beta hydrolase domain containing 18